MNFIFSKISECMLISIMDENYPHFLVIFSGDFSLDILSTFKAKERDVVVTVNLKMIDSISF